MKNGDPRSPAWLRRAMKEFERDDEAVQTALMLVTCDPTPSVDTIRTWTPEQCLLAIDWAWNVHFRASDNINRVPAVPEHLKPYQRVYPRQPAAIVAHQAVKEMSGDNGVCFAPTVPQWNELERGIARMQKAGCFFTEAEIQLWAAGAEHEALEHFQKFDGFDQAHAVMVEIFENRAVA